MSLVDPNPRVHYFKGQSAPQEQEHATNYMTRGKYWRAQIVLLDLVPASYTLLTNSLNQVFF